MPWHGAPVASPPPRSGCILTSALTDGITLFACGELVRHVFLSLLYTIRKCTWIRYLGYSSWWFGQISAYYGAWLPTVFGMGLPTSLIRPCISTRPTINIRPTAAPTDCENVIQRRRVAWTLGACGQWVWTVSRERRLAWRGAVWRIVVQSNWPLIRKTLPRGARTRQTDCYCVVIGARPQRNEK